MCIWFHFARTLQCALKVCCTLIVLYFDGACGDAHLLRLRHQNEMCSLLHIQLVDCNIWMQFRYPLHYLTLNLSIYINYSTIDSSIFLSQKYIIKCKYDILSHISCKKYFLQSWLKRFSTSLILPMIKHAL